MILDESMIRVVKDSIGENGRAVTTKPFKVYVEHYAVKAGRGSARRFGTFTAAYAAGVKFITKHNAKQAESSTTDDNDAHARRHAAQSRVASAIEHLENARAQLDAACADISSIVGASSNYNRIRKLSIGVVEARRLLDENYHDSTYGASALAGRQWALDHTPKTAKSASHGCSLAVLLVALAFAAGCTDHGEPGRPDASPKYDACDPTISKDCPPPDAAKPIPPDAVLPLQSCESLGCSYADYIATCSHSLECVCNNQTCQGTAQ